MINIEEEDDDDFVEIVADIKSHERRPNSDQIISVLDDEESRDSNHSEKTKNLNQESAEPNNKLSQGGSNCTECPICLDSVTTSGSHRSNFYRI